jgi:hypothetical protein
VSTQQEKEALKRTLEDLAFVAPIGIKLFLENLGKQAAQCRETGAGGGKEPQTWLHGTPTYVEVASA